MTRRFELRMPVGMFIGLAISASSGCTKSRSLPESGTYSEQLYVQRCGTCHRPYNPASMTAGMWEVQIEAMRVKIAQAGQPPLSGDQHLAILNYLKRNAGSD